MQARVIDRKAYESALSEFLRPLPSRWLVTATSRVSAHPERFSKEWRYSMRELNRDLYGRQFSPARDLGVAWLLAHERHKSGEPHAHAIVYAMEPLDLLARRTDTKAVLNDRLGFARVEAVRSPDRAHAYACKYVVKGGELEFSDNFHNFVRYYREAA